MTMHPTASKQDWAAARLDLLAREKEFTRARDALSAARRALPWEKVEKDYVFEGEKGPVGFADLFGGKSQLIVQHFMFGPDWESGCKSCSFWIDNYERILVHLSHRDVTLVAVSRAPLERLLAYKRRMGWSLDWFSSLGNSFNFDYGVSFTPDELARPDKNYNFGTRKFGMEEAPGISVFIRDGGAILRTYSTYSRGLDMLNGAYHLLDLLPKGRDEEGLSYGMEWLRRRDEYEKQHNGDDNA
jgi:predicted dithiol-disulfide oxidoreductase (DUF899 family)